MKNTNGFFKNSFFEIIKTEWRKQYDREDGLGLVVVAEEKGAWIAKIEKDDEGYFIIPRVEYRLNSKIKETNLKITDLSIKMENKS